MQARARTATWTLQIAVALALVGVPAFAAGPRTTSGRAEVSSPKLWRNPGAWRAYRRGWKEFKRAHDDQPFTRAETRQSKLDYLHYQATGQLPGRLTPAGRLTRYRKQTAGYVASVVSDLGIEIQVGHAKGSAETAFSRKMEGFERAVDHLEFTAAFRATHAVEAAPGPERDAARQLLAAFGKNRENIQKQFNLIKSDGWMGFAGAGFEALYERVFRAELKLEELAK